MRPVVLTSPRPQRNSCLNCMLDAGAGAGAAVDVGVGAGLGSAVPCVGDPMTIWHRQGRDVDQVTPGCGVKCMSFWL